MPKRNPRRTDKEWLDLIQECRSSGLSDMLLISQFVTNQICSHVTDLLSFVSLAFWEAAGVRSLKKSGKKVIFT